MNSHRIILETRLAQVRKDFEGIRERNRRGQLTPAHLEATLADVLPDLDRIYTAVKKSREQAA